MHYFLRYSRKKIITIFVCLISTYVSAQKEVFPGFHINNNGDTVKGIFPGYRQWQNNPDKVEFIPVSSGTPMVLTPADCRLLNIEGYDQYITYSGQRMTNPITSAKAIEQANFGGEDQYQNVNVFLRLIATADSLQVFMLKDKLRWNFFYRLKDQPIKELLFKINFQDNRTTEFPVYKHQLRMLFQNELPEMDISKILNLLYYNEESIVDFINKIKPGTKILPKQNNPSDGFVILGGVAVNLFNFSREGSAQIPNYDFASSISPILGIAYKATIKRSFGKYFFFPNLNIYSFKHSGQAIEYGYKTTRTFNSKMILNPGIGFGYNFLNRDDLKTFISVCAGSLILINNDQTKSWTNPTNDPISEKTNEDAISSNIRFGGGVQFKNKILAFLNFSLPSIVANHSSYTGKHASFQLSLGYKLSK